MITPQIKTEGLRAGGVMLYQEPPNLPPSISDRFVYYVAPFVNLLTRVVRPLTNVTLFITHFIFSVCSAIQEVFFRLLFRPDFNPYTQAFQDRINGFEKMEESLQQRIYGLKQRFTKNHTFMYDVQELKGLINEISTISNQLDHYVEVLEQREHPLPIQPQLVRLKADYQQFMIQINQYLIHGFPTILKNFEEIIDIFAVGGGINLPQEIRKQLMQIWKELHELVEDNDDQIGEYENKLKELNDQIEELSLTKPIDQPVVTQELVPFSFVNFRNSCYLASMLQALFCNPQLCAAFVQPLSPIGISSKDYTSKLAIQKELTGFIQAKNPMPQTTMEMILFILQSPPSIDRLRKAIFDSGFHPEFDPKQVYAQYDAAFVADMLLLHFLPQFQIHFRQHAVVSPDFPGVQFRGPLSEESLLQVSIPPLPKQTKGKSAEKYQQQVERWKELDFMIKYELERYKNEKNAFTDPTGRIFDPQDQNALIVDKESAETVETAPAQRVKRFQHWTTIEKAPEVLVLQCKRFICIPPTNGQRARSFKNNQPVVLPPEGLVNLTRFCHEVNADNQPQEVLYDLNSFVVHRGGLEGGHYIAMVKKAGKFFECDDMSQNLYKEITKEEFYGCKDAYMLVLQRIRN